STKAESSDLGWRISLLPLGCQRRPLHCNIRRKPRFALVSFEGVRRSLVCRLRSETRKRWYASHNDSLVSAYFTFPGPQSARPGFAPVCSPSLSTCTPFTKTCLTPVAY